MTDYWHDYWQNVKDERRAAYERHPPAVDSLAYRPDQGETK